MLTDAEASTSEEVIRQVPTGYAENIPSLCN